MKKLLYILLFVPLALCGQENYSLSFDGIDDYVEIEHNTENEIFAPQSSITIQASVRFNANSNYSVIASHHFTSQFGWYLRRDLETNTFRFNFNTDSTGFTSIYSTQDIPLNEWIFVTAVYDGNNSKIFIDGIDVTYIDTTIYSHINGRLITPETGGIILGNGLWGSNNDMCMEGNINKVQIWNKALSNQEINDYINCLPTGNEEGLLGYWNFNEGAGNIVYDISGNGIHGTIHGASYTDDVPEQYCDENTFISEASLNEGLVAYYPFNGNANDESGNNLNGVVNNATLTTDRFGNENSAYLFNSNFPSYIQLPELSTDLGAPNKSISISLWFFDEGSASQKGVLFHGRSPSHQYQFGRIEVCQNEDKVGIYHRNPTTDNSPESIVQFNDEWNHIVIVIDGVDGDYRFYLNGDEINDMSFSFNSNESYYNENRTWQIGAISFVPSYHQFIGSIDDIRVWDRVILEEEISELYEILENTPVGVNGCMDDTACNYNPEANMADGSCEYSDLGYDCEGNLIEYIIGMEAEGGVVFYVDSTGERGLVASFEDLEGTYEWGCFGQNVFGADGQYIGSGYQNTIDIINQDCISQNGGITAAQATLNYESNGYNDWFLPSLQELLIMYNSLANNQLNDTSFELEDYSWYWTSTEHDINNSWNVNFIDGDDDHDKQNEFDNVRPVRAFGYTFGCMDSLYLEYYSQGYEANADDGSCLTDAVFGCTDSSYLEYYGFTDFSIPIDIETYEDNISSNIIPNIDDGSCSHEIIIGCFNTIATNHNPEITIHDVNICEGAYGCTYDTYLEYNIYALVNNGSCLTPVALGCTDSQAFNYNPDANVDDESCYPIIYGCMNPIAANYVNPIGDTHLDVNTEDGSCLFSVQVYDDITTTNSNLEQDLSVFETIEEVHYSMSFDGENDYIQLGNSNLLPDSAITISTWFKSLGVSAGDDIFISDVSWSTYTIEIGPQGQIGFRIQPNAGSGGDVTYISTEDSGINYSDGNWYYLTCSWDGSNMAVYINGSLYSQVPTNFSSVGFTNDNPTIGSYPTTTQSFFNGKLEEFQIWNIALSEQQIQQYMNCRPLGDEDDLFGYWNFNEGLGDTVYDLSGNGNHGVIYGAEFSEDVPESYDGCTDENALNYDETALCDNGSCVYGDDIVSNLEEELSVFETVEEVQDYSMSFNGIDNHIVNNSINPGPSSFTFQGNIYLDEAIFQTAYEMILQKGVTNSGESGFTLRYDSDVNSDPVFRASIFYSNSEAINLISNDSIETNQWYNITMTIDRENNLFSLYLDAELIDQQEIGPNPNFQDLSNNFPLDIGRHYWMSDSSHYYNGRMNDFGFWNVALTHEQIQSYMSCAPLGLEEGLICFWSFNEGSGDTIYDISGNGNHGIVYGAEYSKDVPKSYDGCTDENAMNYDSTAQCDNGSCVYGDEAFSNLQEDYNTLNTNLNNTIDEVTTSLSSLQQALDAWNKTIDLSAGWNIFGYGCPTSIDVDEGLSNYTESIIITKHNNGNVYIPEFGFNGIGNFIPGYGYQIKLTEAIEDFTLCDWYVNDIPEDNIVSLQEQNASLQAFVDSVNASGCTDSLACNFDITHLYDDGSCGYAEQGYDCDGNITAQIGDIMEGGYLFYIDDSGKHGLIAAIEDLEGNYEWGCYLDPTFNTYAIGTSIGTGYQNTIDINEECETEHGGITAANAVLSYEYSTFSDWYLPSKDELNELFNSIGDQFRVNLEGTVYWSSSQFSNPRVWGFNVNSNNLSDIDKDLPGVNARPIRSF